MPTIDSTKFTEKLTLMRRSSTKDSFGQKKGPFTVVRNLFGEVLPGQIGEEVGNKVVNFAENYEVNTWYAIDITSKDQLVYNGDNYNIISLVPADGRMFLKLKIVKIYD